MILSPERFRTTGNTMRILTRLIFLIAIWSSSAETNGTMTWEEYKVKFSKSYPPGEDLMRQAIFEFNSAEVRRHNVLAEKGVHSHVLGLNPFSDLTPTEFQNFLNKLLIYINRHKHDEDEDYFEDGEDYVPKVPTKLLPLEMDWRTRGVVTPVKDQGRCGCCWAISAAGAMEGAWALAKGQLLNLSIQNLLDCTPGPGNFGCDGGNMDSAFQYVISNGGINEENCYSFDQMQHSRCRYKKKCRVATFSKFYDIEENDELAIQEALVTQGPVAAAINGDAHDFQHYKSGIYSRKVCPSKVTHGILIVGYGTENGKDYWIVKNSWGPSWGMDGYFHLARNQNMCGIAVMASFPVV